MLEEERRASQQRLLYQMSPARYGVDLDHLRRADALEIVVGQGAKPGQELGLLLGMKVSPRVSEMRTLQKSGPALDHSSSGFPWGGRSCG